MRRRDLLAALALLGPVACSAKRGARRLEGSILGASHARGHRLLAELAGPVTRRETTHVAIVGSGMAGLCASRALDRRGRRDHVVLELEDDAGGTARSGRSPVSAYPWGAHYVPVPVDRNPELEDLLEELGAVDHREADGRPRWAENVLCREPEERLFFRGEWYEGLYARAGASAEDLRQLERFQAETKTWSQWRDARGRPAFALPRRAGSDAPEVRALDGLSMERWMGDRGYTSERLRWLVDYGCRDDFGGRPAQTSAWAGLHYFASRLTSAGEAVPVLTWPEGNGRLVSHLATGCGDRLRRGALALDVQPEKDHVRVRYLDVVRGDTVELTAEHAILAVPRFVAARLLAPWRASPPGWLRSTVYGSWVVANLTLRDRPRNRGFALAWDNVPYASEGLGYVVATHQSGRDQGATVFTYYLALTDDDPAAARRTLLGTTWEQWVDRVMADLRAPHPDLPDLLERADVMLWGHAMVRPGPGFVWSDDLRRAAEPVGRVHFAHTDLSGIALVEEALDHGTRAAEAVCSA